MWEKVKKFFKIISLRMGSHECMKIASRIASMESAKLSAEVQSCLYDAKEAMYQASMEFDYVIEELQQK